MHVYADEKDVEPLIKAVGSRGLLISLGFNDVEAARKFVDGYGVMYDR